jgi:hypothetical protein
MRALFSGERLKIVLATFPHELLEGTRRLALTFLLIVPLKNNCSGTGDGGIDSQSRQPWAPSFWYGRRTFKTLMVIVAAAAVSIGAITYPLIGALIAMISLGVIVRSTEADERNA